MINLLPSGTSNWYERLIDRTYWAWKRRNRFCAKCSVRWTKDHKVNYGIAFDSTNRLYHEECLPKNDTPRS